MLIRVRAIVSRFFKATQFAHFLQVEQSLGTNLNEPKEIEWRADLEDFLSDGNF